LSGFEFVLGGGNEQSYQCLLRSLYALSNFYFYFYFFCGSFCCSALSVTYYEGQNDMFSRTSQLLFTGRPALGALTGGISPPVMYTISQNKRT
jgi:hypothetical protein